MIVKVKSKVVPTSFLRIVGRGTFVRAEKLIKGVVGRIERRSELKS